MICPHCRTDNPEAARVCRGCARLLDGPAVELPVQETSPYARRSRLLTWAILAGLALLVIVCAVLAVSALPRA